MAKTATLGRRRFLRGLGGALVVAPFLSSVGERAARGGAASGSGPPRLIVMFTHYGCITERWFPATAHGPLTASDLAGTSLEVLAPHVSKLLIPRGIRGMNEWSFDLGLGQGNNADTQTAGSYFTCAPVSPHASDPFTTSPAARYQAMPTAPSLDHVCAQQVSPGRQPLLLRVGNHSDTPVSAISYSEALSPFAGTGALSAAFDELTGLFSSGASTEESYAVLRRNSVIDLVREELTELERLDVSAADRLKLEAWKDLLHETSGALTSALCNEEFAATLGLAETNLGAPTDPDGDALTTKVTAELDVADLYSNLAVLSALCDHNRVIFVKYPSIFVFRGLGITVDSHSLSNRTGSASMNGSCLPGVNDTLLTLDRYYAEKFAHLVWQLDQIAEGDGTLLDATATVWFQQWSDGAALNMNNLPILQAGSCGGYFKTGVAVNVEDGDPALSRGNSEAACGPDGAARLSDIKASGTPVELANAPINKYYCNLMNALGVKAGPDGFPAVGGTEPVTHYGMYDDTRDFASGGENPPKLNDPGEFEDLRA